MLEGRGLVKRFGGLAAVDEVDFYIEKGTIVGLIGPNGSGKTTLFNLITGFYRPDKGAIEFKGQSIVNKKPHEIAKMGIGRTFQIVKPFLSMTVLENVAVAGLYGHANLKSRREALRYAEKWVDLCNLAPKANALAEELTLVETRKLELARALAVQPELILLDESLAGLNPTEENEALATIKKIRSELGITLFIIEHRMRAIMEVCEEIIVLHHGKKIAEGSPKEVTSSPIVIESYLGKYQ